MPDVNTKNELILDTGLLLPILSLVGIGLIMVYSSSSALALKNYGNSYYFVKKQLIFALSGAFILFTCANIPYRLYRYLAYVFLLITTVLLIATKFTGYAHSAGGATRWITMGAFSFQPSEFARLAIVIYLAYSLDKKKEKLQDFSIGFIPHIIVVGLISVLILLQPDFGSVVILGMIAWIMMFVGGVKLTHLFLPLLLILPCAYLFMTNAEYRLKRLLSFIDPWKYPTDEGYQIIQSLYAYGKGGLFGTGFGEGLQKLFYLPEPHTDFIFSVIGEELGFFGVMIIITLYIIIIWRGIMISKNSDDSFGSILALGITTAIGLQICINIFVTMGLLPTKGLTLPLLSYGGTSLLLNLASLGILINIGASVKKVRRS